MYTRMGSIVSAEHASGTPWAAQSCHKRIQTPGGDYEPISPGRLEYGSTRPGGVVDLFFVWETGIWSDGACSCVLLGFGCDSGAFSSRSILCDPTRLRACPLAISAFNRENIQGSGVMPWSMLSGGASRFSRRGSRAVRAISSIKSTKSKLASRTKNCEFFRLLLELGGVGSY